MKNSFYIDLQKFMLIPTKFPLSHVLPMKEMYIYAKTPVVLYIYTFSLFYNT